MFEIIRARPRRRLAILMFSITLSSLLAVHPIFADQLEIVPVEGQPLAANVKRLLEAMEYLGAPLPADTAEALAAAGRARDGRKLQQLLDPGVLFVVSINPESRVQVARGPAGVPRQRRPRRPAATEATCSRFLLPAANLSR